MQYTEEHYAQMYNDLPEGLKELVLSGRLAIMVSAIGSRHGLNADQVADLEPAIEDVCLGLITKDELVDNIVKNVNVDQRVANRIAAEAELEILNPFDAELLISRKQKEDLDAKIANVPKAAAIKTANQQEKPQPKDVSEHVNYKKEEGGETNDGKKVANWYNKGDASGVFDWDKTLGKKEGAEEIKAENTSPNIEQKLDKLTESINNLVNSRFGGAEKKDLGVSTEMQELLKRLEKAEKENEENKRLIQDLQKQKISTPTESIFGDRVTQNKIQIDKERKVDIAKEEIKKTENTNSGTVASGNIQVTSISNNIPITQKESEIISSSVSKDTLDSILETRSKPTPTKNQNATQVSTKKVLSLDELISKGDTKIKEAQNKPIREGTLVFPGVNDEKKVDIKNISQKDSLRQTLLDDLEFLKKPANEDIDKVQNDSAEKVSDSNNDFSNNSTPSNSDNDETVKEEDTDTSQNTDHISSTTTNLFKEELLPKTKEERMQALQEKIKALNKGVSVGGKTNISASGLDPYKI